MTIIVSPYTARSSYKTTVEGLIKEKLEAAASTARSVGDDVNMDERAIQIVQLDMQIQVLTELIANLIESMDQPYLFIGANLKPSDADIEFK